MSRPTRGSHDALPVRACHPLWSAVPDASGSRRTTTGLVPVRSPLLRESRLMSFPPGTEMVQFPGFAPPAHAFDRRYRSCGGLPHSEIRGSTGARPSPRLIAACHVLHRLSAPRHPPDALLSLAPPQPRNHLGPGTGTPEHTLPTVDRPRIPRERSHPAAHGMPHATALDPLHDVQTPTATRPISAIGLVGPGRIERPTSPLSGVRSDLLSYGPGPTTPPRKPNAHGRKSGEPVGMCGRRPKAGPWIRVAPVP